MYVVLRMGSSPIYNLFFIHDAFLMVTLMFYGLKKHIQSTILNRAVVIDDNANLYMLTKRCCHR